MEAVATSAQQRCSESEDSSTMADSALCHLLEEEYYLMKVLECLVQDGLQECRRVCRKWKAACDKLPLNISVYAAHQTPFAVRQFPNQTYLYFSLNANSRTENGEEMETCLDAALFQHLSQLKHLKELSAWVRGTWHFSNSIETSFKALQQLQRLDMVLHDKTEGLPFVYSSLRSLTKLTLLYLYTHDPGVVSLEPFTELRRLKELGVCSHLLANEDGALLFPPSAALTRLILNLEPSFSKHENHILQVLSPYASSLVSLEFWRLKPYTGISFANHALLTCFSKLKILGLPEQKQQPTDLFHALKRMEHLTELDVRRIYEMSSVPVEAVVCLTQLKRLFLFRELKTDKKYLPAHDISVLTQLTRLAIDGYDVGTSVTCLTNLTSLFFYSPLPGLDDSWSLSGISNLTWLSFNCHIAPVLCGDVLLDLKSLKHVEMYFFDADGSEKVFQTLTGLTELTGLKILSNPGQGVLSALSQMTVLTNLLSLELIYDPPRHPFEYILEGTLPKLRYITAEFPDLLEESGEELRRRLPSLRKLLIRRQTGYVE